MIYQPLKGNRISAADGQDVIVLATGYGAGRGTGIAPAWVGA